MIPTEGKIYRLHNFFESLFIRFLQDKFFSNDKYDDFINDLYDEDILDNNDIDIIQNRIKEKENDDFER